MEEEQGQAGAGAGGGAVSTEGNETGFYNRRMHNYPLIKVQDAA